MHLFCTFLLIFFLCIANISWVNADGDECAHQKSSVSLLIHIHLLFAGPLPLFMRTAQFSNDPQRRHDFLAHLSNIVRYHALHSDHPSLVDSPILRSLHLLHCSPVQYNYSYEYSVLDPGTLHRLDHQVYTLINSSSTIFIDPTETADTFYTILSERIHIHQPRAPSAYERTSYLFLVYDATTVPLQYGYRVETAGSVLNVGIASFNRFAFVDVGSRPFLFDETADPTPGENLLSASRSSLEYAKVLHSLISTIITPPVSSNMRRFPPESRIAFSLNLVDAAPVVAQNRTGDIPSDAVLPTAASFNSSQFLSVLRSSLNHVSETEKTLSLSVSTVNITHDASMAMAVSRAFSRTSIHLTLDARQLLSHLVNEKERTSFIDDSFVIHIPLYLFSFIDTSRTVQLQHSKSFHAASVAGKQVIFIVENRVREFSRDAVSTTKEAVGKVLTLLCGLHDDALSHINVFNNIPVILKDQIQRNLLVDQIDWSERVAAGKARKLINFEGLDSRLIPHGHGSEIEASRDEVKKKLKDLEGIWRASSLSLVTTGIQVTTLQLVKVCARLAAKLHAEVCNQRLPEEILLRAKADLDGDENHRASTHSYGGTVFIPILCGIITGLVMSFRSDIARRQRLDLSSVPFKEDQPKIVTWFSTLQYNNNDKRKRN